MNKFIGGVIVGGLLGAGIYISGIWKFSVISAFFNTGEDWDPTLGIVIASAVGTFLVGMAVLKMIRPSNK
jgi:hypothetical protein